jgi:hypothetical protein
MGMNALNPCSYGETAGASLQGYLKDGSLFRDIVDVLGKPQRGDDSGKVRVWWYGKINGLVFTLYDYKCQTALIVNADWHIGGHDPRVADLLNALIGGYKA